jgi:SWI/SNF-related matrix-associated actin-dependent regulator 1 of chromatin subfamily A
MADSLDSQAAAFAQLLKLSGDPDAAFRSAVALADGLFPHQIEGVAFLLGRRRAILADDMGLGKTRQAIVSLRHMTPGGPASSSVRLPSNETGRARSASSRRVPPSR